MRFGLFGSASARRGGAGIRQQRGISRFHRIQRGGGGARLSQHVRRGAPFHGIRSGLGHAESPHLARGAHEPPPSRHCGDGAAMAQPGAAGRTGRDARSPVRGRLDFGIGKGYRYNEFAGFRMSMEDADARFDECLEVLLKAWTADEPFSHRGKYWEFDDIVVEPPPAQKPHPQIWMGAGSERSIRRVAAQGFNLLLGQYASLTSVASHIAAYKSEVEARGRRFDPMQVGVTRAFFVTDAAEERQAALERRLQNRVRQLKLATWPDGTVLGGPDRATGDPRTINENSAMYGTPDEVAKRLEELRDVGVGYVLINGGGSGGGARGRESLRRFAREVMPAFAD